jgi:hypothetical protein
VRLDEQGISVERRGHGAWQVPWELLSVSERRGARRAPAGLVLERTDEEEPFWLPLQGLGDEQAVALKQALRARLGERYSEEGNESHGAGRV